TRPIGPRSNRIAISCCGCAIASASCSAKSAKHSRESKTARTGGARNAAAKSGSSGSRRAPSPRFASHANPHRKRASRRSEYASNPENRTAMKVKKAVILAAGMGTRMLPSSKVIAKELLPVVDTPAIQVVVEEAVASGIAEIILVISPGKTTVADHFEPNAELERYLEARDKLDILELVRRSNNPARITIAEQHRPLGLGHAVLQAREAVGDEPFAVMLPDDIFDCPRPCLRQLLDVAETRDAPVVALLKVARSELSKYGIVDLKAVGERTYELRGMVEKPAPEKAPSEFAIMGRYVLTPDIFDLLAAGRPGAGGEIQLTDALMALTGRRKIYGYEFEGVRYDLGDRVGFISAQIGFGLKRADLAERLRAYLKSVISQ